MKKSVFLIAISIINIYFSITQAQVAPSKFGPVPNERQMKYLQNPMAGFIHFGMNTYAGSDGIEWGNDVKRPASTFNPPNGKVDTDQWIRLFKKAGFTRVIITLKHHDGFCLWPTKQTDYNISKSPYQGGNGDLAKELSLSCDKYDMEMGIYLSPWDAWEPSYGDASTGDYNIFYDNQLRELLGGEYGKLNTATGKREICEIWLDGATGSGTAHQTYDFARFVSTVRELQPKCLTWMSLAAGENYTGSEENFPVDAFWVGNERGYVNDPVWMKVNVNGSSVSNYQATGKYFCVPEADVSIRPGWFYHAAQDGAVKSLSVLTNDIFLRSVGMSIPLLLNIPPNREGKFHANDSTSLIRLGNAVKNTFSQNLITPQMTATSSASRGTGFDASKAIDGNYDTYWTMVDGQTTGTLTIDFGKTIEMDVIRIQEYLPLGQRISGFKTEVDVYGQWREFGSGQTVGYQRVVKGVLMPVNKVRLTITSSLAVPLICNLEVFRSDASITTMGTLPAGFEEKKAENFQTIAPQKISKLKFEVVSVASGKWPTIAEMRFFTRENGNLVEIPRTGFTTTATSYSKNSTAESPCPPSNTLDGNNSTIWQPEWSPSKVSLPQSVTYDFGKQILCSDIMYLPRQSSTGDIPTVFNIYTAENAADELKLTVANGTFLSGINTAQTSPINNSDWTVLQNYGKGGTAIQSKTAGVKAVFNVNSSWFRLIGGKGPAFGTMDISIDGIKKTTIDCYSPVTKADVILYEISGLNGTTKTVEISVTGNKNNAATDNLIILQRAEALQTGVNGMFELKRSTIDVQENTGTLNFDIIRKGSLGEAASVTVVTSPGTGVHGKNYIDASATLHFEAGESLKTASVQILENDFREGNKDFYIELANPTNLHVPGFLHKARVVIYDNDSITTNASIEGYCVPGGTQHSGKKAYLESASSTGAEVNLSYNASACPDNVYQKLTTNEIQARKGSVFTLKLNAFKAGPRTTSAVYEDFRYHRLFLYADWNGDLNFTDDEKIAEYGTFPPANNILGNYDAIMTVEQQIEVPQDALLQNIPLRAYYHNAWRAFESVCSDVYNGMVYDFNMKILPEATSEVKNPVKKFRIFRRGFFLCCEGEFENDTLVSLTDLQGKKMIKMFVNQQSREANIPVANLPNGVYLVTLSSNYVTETHKTVIM